MATKPKRLKKSLRGVELVPTTTATTDIAKQVLSSTDIPTKQPPLLGNNDTPVIAVDESSNFPFRRHFHTSTHRHAEIAVPQAEIEPQVGLNRLGSAFYDVPCQELAMQLLGQTLVRQLEDGTLLKGKIVETECYLGGEDKASHSFNGKVTERTEPMYMKPGTMYVYFTYGMYHCFNISSQGPGAAVLLRALEPLEGKEYMLYQRRNHVTRRPANHDDPFAQRMQGNIVQKSRKFKEHELCNGPAKLCISLDIGRKLCNKQNLTEWAGMWIEKGIDLQEQDIVKTARIGIDSAGIEWATKPLRFYILDNKAVSKRDLATEKTLRELASFLTK